MSAKASYVNERIGPVLVTGGSGFLGQALSQALVDQGEQVISVDLAANKPTADIDKGIVVETADILAAGPLEAIARTYQVQAIVHLAALVIPACRVEPIKGVDINIGGHINLLEIARRLNIRRFVYASSIASKPREPLGSPVNLYGAYKRCCEDIAKIWFLDYDVPSIGLRPNVVYGPGREVGETAAITLAIKAAAGGEFYQMPFAGAMCFQYIDEVIDIIHRCLVLDHHSAVVTDLTTNVETIDELIACIHTLAPSANILPSHRQRPAPPRLDNTVLQSLLGEWPSISLQEGVTRTYRHYQNQSQTAAR